MASLKVKKSSAGGYLVFIRPAPRKPVSRVALVCKMGSKWEICCPIQRVPLAKYPTKKAALEALGRAR